MSAWLIVPAVVAAWTLAGLILAWPLARAADKPTPRQED